VSETCKGASTWNVVSTLDFDNQQARDHAHRPSICGDDFEECKTEMHAIHRQLIKIHYLRLGQASNRRRMLGREVSLTFES